MRKNRITAKTLMLCMAALVFTLSVSLVIGVTFARYRASFRSAGSVGLIYDYSSSGIFMLGDETDENGELTAAPVTDENGTYKSPGGWTQVSDEGDEYKLSFLISNCDAENSTATFDQNGALQVFVSDGASSDSITITLDAYNTVYTATGEDVIEGSPFYDSYGPGILYTFRDKNNDQITWSLPGGEPVMIPVTVTVSGSPEYPAAVTVILSAKPVS